jgi:hypothetical protein
MHQCPGSVQQVAVVQRIRQGRLQERQRRSDMVALLGSRQTALP